MYLGIMRCQRQDRLFPCCAGGQHPPKQDRNERPKALSVPYVIHPTLFYHFNCKLSVKKCFQMHNRMFH